MKFILEIELGNEAMQTPADVSRALMLAAERIDAHDRFDMTIRDDNGNAVGGSRVTA